MDIGKFNRLKVKKEVDFGVYLDSDAGEILLPKRYVPKGTRIGDELDVFVYKDSEDRTIATTLTPKAVVGDFAYLRVKDVNRNGAFLDWGIEKDLLVPYSEQSKKMEAGGKYIVRVFLDERTGRITATTKINRFIEKEDILVCEGEDVDLLVYQFTDLGIKVIINNRYFGVLYRNEVYQKLNIGDRIKGFIKKIREDRKIDVSIKRTGPEDIEASMKLILKELKDRRGFLPLGDNSPPGLIREMLRMSKRTFKKAIGGLYKEGVIELKEDGIKLKRVDKTRIIHRFKF
ncbi:MAG: GntR family transcriptional regulator [Nitrospirae bacterium]|nr:GntR family transcriptional regulator [Nitrospirota bacterium]